MSGRIIYTTKNAHIISDNVFGDWEVKETSCGLVQLKGTTCFRHFSGWMILGCKIKCTVIKYGREGVPGCLISWKCCVNNTASCRLSALFGREPWDAGLTISIPGNERGKRHPLLDMSRYCTELKLPGVCSLPLATAAPLICQTMSQVDVKYTRKKRQLQ